MDRMDALTQRPILWAAAAAFVLLAIVAVAVQLYSRGEFEREGIAIANGPPPPLPQVGLPDAVAPEEELLPVEPETAREMNAARPFSSAKLVAARPFRSRLIGEDRERAVTCLAIAAVYEAGGGADDQLPVMQVILNRVRHPAWPNSICAVVFQGAERQTGCQFSFTCDGSMLRWRPSASALAGARTRAASMIDGKVEPRVGLATHYHTDWVLPYWSNSLDKITAVRTHLFFRWNGYWGTRAAFGDIPAGIEPRVAQLASYTNAHSVGESPLSEEETALATGDAAMPETPSVTVATDVATRIELPQVPVLKLALDTKGQPGRWALDALEMCAGRAECRVVGWLDAAAAPARLTRETVAQAAPNFVFVQELRNRTRQAYWDCNRWPKASTSRCLSGGSQAADLLF